MRKEPILDLFDFLPKSKIKAGDGLESGIYPFYTSSETQSKFLNDYQNGPGCLVFGTGGKASVHFTKSKFATSTDCISIKPKNTQKLFGEYVFQYLKGNIEILEAGFKGAGLKHISKKYLSEIQILLPSFDDQKRIAHLLGKVEGMIARRKQHLQQLDELLKSVFLEMFGDPVRNEKGWEKKALSKLVKEKIGYGIVQPGNPVEDGIPTIRVGDFNGIKINKSGIQKVTREISNKHKASILKGDEILLACVGATIGKVAIVDEELMGFNIVRATARIRAAEKIDRYFLAYYLISDFSQNYYKKVTRAVGQPTLNIKQISEHQVILPPITLQNQFATIVEKVESLKSRYQSSLSNLENLYGTLSQKAFKGELDLGRVVLLVEEKIEMGA